MRNKHPATCYRCGNRVEVGDGHFERHNGGWRTQHAMCAIIARDGAEAAMEAWLSRATQSLVESGVKPKSARLMAINALSSLEEDMDSEEAALRVDPEQQAGDYAASEASE